MDALLHGREVPGSHTAWSRQTKARRRKALFSSISSTYPEVVLGTVPDIESVSRALGAATHAVHARRHYVASGQILGLATPELYVGTSLAGIRVRSPATSSAS